MITLEWEKRRYLAVPFLGDYAFHFGNFGSKGLGEIGIINIRLVEQECIRYVVEGINV